LNAGAHASEKTIKTAWFEHFIGPGPDDIDPYKIPDPEHPGKYLQPKNLTDAAAQKHDKRYFEAKASGVQGALLDTNVRDADMALVGDSYKVMEDYVNGKIDTWTNKPISYKTFFEAQAIVTVFAPISSYKYAVYSIQQSFKFLKQW